MIDTVADLIRELQKLDPLLKVVTSDGDSVGSIESITVIGSVAYLDHEVYI